MLVDGKKIAEDIIAGLGVSLRGKRLGIVVGTQDRATDSFIKIKSSVAQRLGAEVLWRAGLLKATPDARSGPRLKRRGRAVVVGAGRLVGAPAAKLLRELGADVSVITQTHGSLDQLTTADIVV